MIFIVLPVYNEAKNIKRVLRSLHSVMSGVDYKIIVVNDGSTDDSLAVLNRLSGQRVKIATYKVNMNVGAVFSTGISRVLTESGNDDDVMIIMESDQTSAINLVPTLIKEIVFGKQDVVIASRYKQPGRYKNFPRLREIYSRGANGLMRWCFPIKAVNDYTIFFRAYRVKVLRRAVKYFGLFGLIQSKGFVANAELLIKLSLLTQRFKEIPFTYNYAKKIGASKIKVWRTINEYFVLVGYLKRIFFKWQNL